MKSPSSNILLESAVQVVNDIDDGISTKEVNLKFLMDVADGKKPLHKPPAVPKVRKPKVEKVKVKKVKVEKVKVKKVKVEKIKVKKVKVEKIKVKKVKVEKIKVIKRTKRIKLKHIKWFNLFKYLNKEDTLVLYKTSYRYTRKYYIHYLTKHFGKEKPQLQVYSNFLKFKM